MQKSFAANEPVTVDLRVELGDFTLTADPDCREARIELRGDEDYIADFSAELQAGQLRIQAPERAGSSVTLNVFGVRLGRGPHVSGSVVVPAGSSLRSDAKAADLTLAGAWENVDARSGSGDLRVASARLLNATSGSGDVTADAVATDARVRTGSGDIILGSVGGALVAQAGSGDVTLRDTIGGDVEARTGSGDISAAAVQGRASLQSGSGDLDARELAGPATLRSASGGITVLTLGGDVEVTSASGDIELRRIAPGDCVVHSSSGDVQVTVPPRVPVWTDVRTLSGDLSNRLEPVGEPEPGEPVIQLRVTTTSGDIRLATARQ